MCNLNVIVVLGFISRGLYLLFALRFYSKFQNSVFYQNMRPKSGLKFPRPFIMLYKIKANVKNSSKYIVYCLFVIRFTFK